MDQFNFYFSFVSLLLGLALTQLAGGIASAIKARREVRIGALTPLLATLMILDVASLWPALWELRSSVEISWWWVSGAAALGLVYYVAVSLVFPDQREGLASLDDWYRDNHRFVLSGVLAVSTVFLGVEVYLRTRGDAQVSWPAFLAQRRSWVLWAGLMVAAIMTKRRSWSFLLLCALVALYLIAPFLVS